MLPPLPLWNYESQTPKPSVEGHFQDYQAENLGQIEDLAQLEVAEILQEFYQLHCFPLVYVYLGLSHWKQQTSTHC